MRCFLSALLLPLLFAPSVCAHPVSEPSNRDRLIVVRLTDKALLVDYRLEIDEGTLVKDNDFPDTERARATSRKELFELYSRFFVDILGRNFDASLDGQELRFTCVQRNSAATDHVRFH